LSYRDHVLLNLVLLRLGLDLALDRLWQAGQPHRVLAVVPDQAAVARRWQEERQGRKHDLDDRGQGKGDPPARARAAQAAHDKAQPRAQHDAHRVDAVVEGQIALAKEAGKVDLIGNYVFLIMNLIIYFFIFLFLFFAYGE